MKRQLALRLVLRWVMVSLAGVLIGYWVRPSFAQAPARSPQVEKIDGREVGLTVPILDFETFGAWRRGDEAWGTFTQSNQQQTSGSYAGQFAYSFPAVPANYIVFRQRANISGRPDGLRIQVYGDGSTHFLNV